jgi:hypothetical protein
MPDVIVKLDIHPATAVMGTSGTTYENVRVLVADDGSGNGDEVMVWRNESGGPAIVFRAPLTSVLGSIRTGYELGTDQATIFTVKSGGCDCGGAQRLGDANLFPALRRVNTTF